MSLLHLRASSLPLAFRCAASVRPAELRIDEVHESANVGTAAHEALRSLAETGSLDWEAIPEIAARHRVDEDEVRMLCALGNTLWQSVSESFGGALTEVALSAELDGVTLTGHVDLLAIHGTVARAGDWKTGRKDSDYSAQMRAYAALILLDNPQLTEVTVTVLWVRDQSIENYTMRREGLRAWLGDLTARVIEWDGVYRPGEHCRHCPRSHECQAANALARRDVAALNDRELVERAENELSQMTAEQILDLHRKVVMVSSYCERVHAAIKEHVAKHGDVVADGKRLTIETQERRQLDPLAAWPVLEAAGFDDEDFARCVDLRISRVEKVVAEKAGRGNGAAAVRKVAKELESAEAVERKQTHKLVQKRA